MTARLPLLLLQELDDEFLVILDEVIRKALLLQVIPEILPPVPVEGVEGGEF